MVRRPRTASAIFSAWATSTPARIAGRPRVAMPSPYENDGAFFLALERFGYDITDQAKAVEAQAKAEAALGQAQPVVRVAGRALDQGAVGKGRLLRLPLPFTDGLRSFEAAAAAGAAAGAAAASAVGATGFACLARASRLFAGSIW